MEKIVSTNQTRIKRKIITTPEDLIIIANQLKEASKFASKNEIVEMDVVVGANVVTFEYSPEKTSALVYTSTSSDDKVQGGFDTTY